MSFLDRLIDRTHAISRLSIWACGGFLVATVLLICAEVVLRKLGSGVVSGASEVGGYMLATCSVWAFSFTLLHRAHIRFDILYVRCSPKVRAVLDCVSLLALGLFIFTVTYHAYAVLSTSIAFGTRSTSTLSVPMWIPQSVWFLGLVFLCWTILLLAVRVLVALIQQDFATVARLAGTSLPDAKIKRETVESPDGMQTPAGRTSKSLEC